MKAITAPFVCSVLALFFLTSCASGPKSSSFDSHKIKIEQRISAADAHFRYEGRFDFSDTNAPVIIWQASRISIDFDGDNLGLLFADAKGQCFFNAEVDGANAIVEVREGNQTDDAKLTHLGYGRHHLVLFKRSEANAGTVRFRGVEIDQDAKIWLPPLVPYKVRMEFIGDSITAGACNEDGDVDQWNNRRTHNAALSYAAMTANAFSADYRNIAVSGMGIATGWVDQKAGEVWDRVYPNPASPRADLSKWTPQIVFVNFGENDASFPNAHGQPFPTNYTSGYVSLVEAIRKTYPAARIILLRGGMYNSAQSEPLRKAWEASVTQLEVTDKSVSYFVFKHWTKNHPRVADDHAMADELIIWLKQQTFMQPYR
jgi:lysophospholipase L1-like esterase